MRSANLLLKKSIADYSRACFNAPFWPEADFGWEPSIASPLEIERCSTQHPELRCIERVQHLADDGLALRGQLPGGKACPRRKRAVFNGCDEMREMRGSHDAPAER